MKGVGMAVKKKAKPKARPKARAKAKPKAKPRAKAKAKPRARAKAKTTTRAKARPKAKARVTARAKAKPKTKAKARRGKAGKGWVAAEISALRVGYKTKPASKLAKELRRSLASVRGKISALGLKKPASARRKKAAPKTKARRRTRR